MTQQEFDILWSEIHNQLNALVDAGLAVTDAYTNNIKNFIKEPRDIKSSNCIRRTFSQLEFIPVASYHKKSQGMLLESMLACISIYSVLEKVNFKDSSKLFVEKSNKILIQKAKEYARNENRLFNFDVASAYFSTGTSSIYSAYSFAVKHFVSIETILMDASNGISTPKEMLFEKLGDAYNYCILMWACLKENEKTYQVQF